MIASEAERSAVEEVVRKLADARLITTEGRETPAPSRAAPIGEGQPPRYVEVAHEALIRGWTQLRQWIDTDRAGLRTHRQLTQAAREWQEHGRDESYLYVGSRLAVAREWSETHTSDLNPLKRDFLDASLALRRRREAAELEAAQALAEAEWKRAEDAEAAAKRQKQLGKQFLTAALVAFLFAIASGVLFLLVNKARNQAVTKRGEGNSSGQRSRIRAAARRALRIRKGQAPGPVTPPGG